MTADKLNTRTVFINEEDFFNKLEKSDAKLFLGDCHLIANKPSFLRIYQDLVSKQMVNMGRKTENMDQLCFMRGTIAGLDLFFEEITKYAQLCEEQARNDEGYDKFKVIEE